MASKGYVSDRSLTRQAKKKIVFEVTVPFGKCVASIQKKYYDEQR